MVEHRRQGARRPPARQEGAAAGPVKSSSPAPKSRPAVASDAAGERVAKALARAGVASRRDVERYIAEGRVAVNGRVLNEPGVKIGPADILTVDGEVVENAEPTRVWRYHKPVGLLTTHKDPAGRPTVFGALPAGMPRVISVGRLDINSEGLLLLTNDGSLARSLELPATGWVRRYRARAYGAVTQDKLDRLKDGVTVDGVHYGAIEARLDKVTRTESTGRANVWITVAVSEGKNREVRKVLESLGLKVNRLIRLAYGPFALATLESGAVEEVGPRVIRELLADHIAPANLPSGDRPVGEKLMPAAKPSAQRRASAATGAKSAKPGAAAGEAKPAKTYKPGWAKPKKRTGPAKPKPKPRAPK
ncbi:MAG: pseudouridine synthase [Pseudomonadota bacterium]|jgi:23S rRNA pseudouridine2605 synthase